jgi:hypothetical protein
MNRHVFGIVLGICIVFVTTQNTVFSEDKVERRDNQNVTGKIISESVAGVKVKAGAKEVLVATTDINRVFYEDMPIASKQAYNNLWVLETNEKDKNKIYKAYQDFMPKMTGAPDSVRRNVEFRLAALQADLADTKPLKDAARLALQAFLTGNPNSWQFPQASRILAKLQIDSNDFDGAQRSLEGITKNQMIPIEFRQEADTMLVDVLFQGNKIEELKTRIDKALEDPKTTPQQKARFGVYLAAIKAKDPNAKFDDVVKDLKKIIEDKASDNAVKGVAFNLLGDSYFGKDMKRDAMWSYLWVDVVYNQDRSEHMKAMNGLLKIFEAENDLEKMQIYKDKIARLR